LSEFMNALPLADLAPDFTTMKHAAGVATHTLSSPKGEYAIYIDGEGPTNLTLTLPPGDYRVTWLDIRTGATQVPPEMKNAAALHHPGGDLRPLRIRQHRVLGRGSYRAMPDRLGVAGPSQRGQRLVQQARQPAKVP